MKDFNKQKRIKMLRKMQGLATVGDVLLDLFIGAMFFATLVLLYLAIKLI